MDITRLLFLIHKHAFVFCNEGELLENVKTILHSNQIEYKDAPYSHPAVLAGDALIVAHAAGGASKVKTIIKMIGNLVESIVILTTKQSLQEQMPDFIDGKEITVVYLPKFIYRKENANEQQQARPVCPTHGGAEQRGVGIGRQ